MYFNFLHLFPILKKGIKNIFKCWKDFLVFHYTINLPCFDTSSTDSITSLSAICLNWFEFEHCFFFAKYTDANTSKAIKITTNIIVTITVTLLLLEGGSTQGCSFVTTSLQVKLGDVLNYSILIVVEIRGSVNRW